MKDETSRIDASSPTYNQSTQTVNGPQTNIRGNVNGSVFSGQFDAPVNFINQHVTYNHVSSASVDASFLANAYIRLTALPIDTLPAYAQLPTGSRIPYSRNPMFMGRSNDLKQLGTASKGDDPTAIGQIVAITGLGGIGKTQLAVEFAHRYGQYFAGGVFWLSFANPANIPNEIVLCGSSAALEMRTDFNNLKFDDQLASVMSAWQSPLPRLLIFDNCEDDATLAHWRPTTGCSHILVTSRRTTWDITLNVQILKLEGLQLEESVNLLQKFRPDLTYLEDTSILSEIATELGGLPLALHMAGSYLKKYMHSPIGQPAQLLADLRKPDLFQHPALTGRANTISPTQHILHVGRTFALSYDNLKPESSTDILAIKALTHTACFAPSELIPRALLTKTFKLGDEQILIAEDALERLVDLGLLGLEPDGSLIIHRLVIAFMKNISNDEEAFASVSATLLFEATSINKKGYLDPLRLWLPHLRSLANEACRRQSKLAGQLLNGVAYHLHLTGNYKEACSIYEQAITIEDNQVPQLEYPLIAMLLNNLGGALSELGDYLTARRMYERAIEIDESALGPDHPEVAVDINNLGLALDHLGDHAGALILLERALKIDENAFGSNHPSTATRLNNLGNLFESKGDYAKAQIMYERALNIFENVFGGDHPKVATLSSNLGGLLCKLGKYSDAHVACKRALQIFERELGPQHPNVATLINNLGEIFRALENYTEACSMFERAIQIFESKFGSQHPDLAIATSNLAIAFSELGNYKDACTMSKRSLKIAETIFGPNHFNTAGYLICLGDMLYANSDYTEAFATFERAIQIFEKEFGSHHPGIATLTNKLGIIMRDVGNYGRALAIFEYALRIDEAAFGVNHPNTARDANYLGELWLVQGNYDKARFLLNYAVSIFTSTLGADHSYTRAAQNNLNCIPKTL
jgi:tetratricopeptide (TPR) repeat protein